MKNEYDCEITIPEAECAFYQTTEENLLAQIVELQHRIDTKLEELLIKFKELETLAETIRK